MKRFLAFKRDANVIFHEGKQLFTQLTEIALERGCGRMEWSVLDWNDAAIKFYRQLNAQAMDDWTLFRLTEEGLQKMLSSDHADKLPKKKVP